MFQTKLRDLRKQSNLSQAMLAKKLNVSSKTISAWELGNRQPSLETLNKISNMFGVTTDYLLGNEKNKPNWATNHDALELDKFLDTNGAMTFEGVELNRSQKARVKKILTEVFWEELKKDRDKGIR